MGFDKVQLKGPPSIFLCPFAALDNRVVQLEGGFLGGSNAQHIMYVNWCNEDLCLNMIQAGCGLLCRKLRPRTAPRTERVSRGLSFHVAVTSGQLPRMLLSRKYHFDSFKRSYS